MICVSVSYIRDSFIQGESFLMMLNIFLQFCSLLYVSIQRKAFHLLSLSFQNVSFLTSCWSWCLGRLLGGWRQYIWTEGQSSFTNFNKTNIWKYHHQHHWLPVHADGHQVKYWSCARPNIHTGGNLIFPKDFLIC